MSFPLAALRVLDLSTEIAGPYATKLLADAGADVLNIEHPDGGDPLRRWTPPRPPGVPGCSSSRRAPTWWSRASRRA
jgi:crotonobetainyl-CoA:carnitine CoA-transferase CaiB-like acyl-CoA transferase